MSRQPTLWRALCFVSCAAALLSALPWRAADAAGGGDVRHRAGFDPVKRSGEDDPGSETGQDESSDPPGEFHVRAVDEFGEPLEGAEVYVLQVIGDSHRRRDWTITPAGPFHGDRDGLARITDLPVHPRGFDQYIYARVPGEKVGGGHRSSYGRPAPDADPFDVTLVDSVELRGKVTVPRGFKLTDVSVRLLALYRNPGNDPCHFSYHSLAPEVWPELFERWVDADGTFVIPDTPAGGVRYLAATTPGLAEAQWMDDAAARRRDIPPTPKMAMRLEGVIEGTVRYPGSGGVPAEGLTVVVTAREGVHVIRAHTAVVAADGRFRIGGLREAGFSVELAELPEGWTLAPRLRVRVRSGQPTRGVDLRLERGAVIAGTVVDSKDGTPLADVAVSAHYLGDQAPASSPLRVADDVTGPDGFFRVRVPGGTSRVQIRRRPPGYRFGADRRWRERTIDAVAGVHQNGVVLKLLRADAR